MARTLVKVLLISSNLSSREELWKADLEGCDKAKNSKWQKPKTVGLQSGEWNVYLAKMLYLDDISENLYQDNIPEDQQLPDIVDENEKKNVSCTDR